MNQADRLQHALAGGDDAELAAACKAASQTLARCREWRSSGAIREAAALNADAGNIIGLALQLSRRPGGPPNGLRLPSPDILDSLARLPAEAASHRDEVERWVELNLSEASLDERMTAIRSLRLLEPRNTAWQSNHEELEVAVVRLWETEADRCIAAGDRDAIANLSEQIQSMGFLGRTGQMLLHKLDIAQTEQLRIAAAEELDPLGVQLHLAWAAMNLPLARRLRTDWRRNAEVATGDHEQDTRTVFQWIDAEDRREAAERALQDRVDDLVRALDELEPLHAIERRYSALRNDDAVVPPAVESRVTHYITEERRKQTRRFVVSLSSIIAIAGVLTSVVAINNYNIKRQNMIESLSDCIKQSLEDGDLLSAQDCWNQAISEELEQSPLIAAHKVGIDRAKETLEERRTQAGMDIVAATSLLESDDATIPRIDEAIALLRDAEEVVRDELLATLKHQLQRGEKLRGALLAETHDEQLRELAAIESLLGENQPALGDRTGWEHRKSSLQRAEHMLLQLRNQHAVVATDLQTKADAIQSRINRLMETASNRLTSIQEAHRLMSDLHRIPNGGCNWYNIWDDLLSHHAEDLLAHNPNAKWDEGRSRAQAACAAENWRKVVLPELTMHGLLGNAAETPNPRSAIMTLKSHLESYPEHQSPYTDVAHRLIEVAQRATGRSGGDALHSRLSATGLFDLYVADTAHGYRYLRPFEIGLRRIDSRQELSVDPRQLKELTASEKTDLYSHERPAVIAVALRNASDAHGTDGITSVDAVCDLLEAVQECPEPDELLHLAVNQMLWELILELNLPLPAQTRIDATDWLGRLRSNAGDAINADWAQRAPTADNSTQSLTRRHAAGELAKSPRHHHIRSLNDADQHVEQTQSMAAARIVHGLLVPDPTAPSGMMRVRLLESEVRRPEVLLSRGKDWRFFQFDDRLSHDDLVEAPQGVHTLPVIIF
ncbi:MAG: hypothetical protein QF471_04885, partial [Phycisphaerales bacterium]|nr:hypothetical protein [Phycisphaerales bacterium]